MRPMFRIAMVALVMLAAHGLAASGPDKQPAEPNDNALRLLDELSRCPFKIIYETYRAGNWELFVMNADGSGQANLTRTPHVDELYPHASPDGSKVTFVAERGEGDKKTRDVFTMNIDGTERVQVGVNGRQPFWSPNGKHIAFLRGTEVSYHEGGHSNRELHMYDLETGRITSHPKTDTVGLFNPCYSPDGRWIIASVMGGMGYRHSVLAIEAAGTGVVEIARSASQPQDVFQCRPDVSSDGKYVAWGMEDLRDFMALEIAEITWDPPEPKISNRRLIVKVPFPLQIYHADWSPDGKYIAYSQGGRGTRMQPAGYVVGTKAKGWDIWVAKPSVPGVAVRLTRDGLSNKEPDWVLAK